MMDAERALRYGELDGAIAGAARALAGEPEIILADEPTAALDKTSGRTVMEMLRGLARERGRAVVIVTHDNRILEYADRIVRIEDGRVAHSSALRGEEE